MYQNLQNFYIGKNLASFGNNIFCLCRSLTNITIHKENTHFVFNDNTLIMDKTTFLHYVPIDPRTKYTIPSGILSQETISDNGTVSPTSFAYWAIISFDISLVIAPC